MLNAYRNTENETASILCYLSAMQQTGVFTASVSRAAFLCLALVPAHLMFIAQSPDSARPVTSSLIDMPADPAKLVSLAAKFNGLVASDVSPWHLKASFAIFNAAGDAIDHGTYEEFWVNPNKRRHIFTSTASTTSTYHNGRKVKILGPQLIPDLVGFMRMGFVDPLPYAEVPSHFSPLKKIGNAQGLQLSCLSAAFNSQAEHATVQISTQSFEASSVQEAELMAQLASVRENTLPIQTHSFTAAMSGSRICFDSDRPLVRLSSDPLGMQTIRNNVFLFNGRYVPHDLLIGESGKTELKAHIEVLEDLKTINDSDYVPPHGAASPKYDPFEYLPQSKIRKLLIHSEEPEYPASAQAAHLSGTVHVRATIGTDGHVRNPHAIDGPLQLQQAAIDAVSKYQFKPYYDHDLAFVVETVFQIDFPGSSRQK